MCEFCTKHGEGKKWYLNVKNYSNDLLSDVKRRIYTEKSGYWISNLYNVKFKFFKLLPKMPLLHNMLTGVIKKWMLYTHWGQVIPIEDVEKVLNFTNSITRIPCVCRHITTKKEHRVCFLISLNPNEIGIADIVDQSFLGGPDVAKFEKVEKKWAIDFIKQMEMKGMIHSIWTFKTPFIGALCNCDYQTGCISMKMYKEVTPVIFRAEYVALIEKDRCVGCKECIKICQFDAIGFDENTKKIKIDIKKCYGCGICRAVCKKNAIHLKDRRSVPEAAILW